MSYYYTIRVGGVRTCIFISNSYPVPDTTPVQCGNSLSLPPGLSLVGQNDLTCSDDGLSLTTEVYAAARGNEFSEPVAMKKKTGKKPPAKNPSSKKSGKKIIK